jgi:hypothetical protein
MITKEEKIKIFEDIISGLKKNSFLKKSNHAHKI